MRNEQLSTDTIAIMTKMYFLLMLTILGYSKGGYITDTQVTAPGIEGAALDGAKYYEVESKDTKVEGCYAKINFHNLHPDARMLKYPIYKQTGGHDNFHYLKVVDEQFAPWVFTDKEENIKYR